MPPVLSTVYPNDLDVGIPLNVSLVLTFDRSVDLETVRQYVALYGDVTDQVSGPDPGTFQTKTGGRPYLFRSPGFKGLVPFTVTAEYQDASGDEVEDDFINWAEEQASTAVAYVVSITPNKPLPPEVTLEYQVIGDPTALGKGISARTIWNPEASGANAGSGTVEAKGTYTGDSNDQLIIRIESTGATGTATYRWYWSSKGDGTGKSGRLTNTGYLTLSEGVAVRFSGTNFVVGDEYYIECDSADRLADSYKVSFTTTDNPYTTVPTSPSTPAEASPPATVIPPAPGAALAETLLTILDISPEEGGYNISIYTNEIVITFSDPIDPATITTDTVRLLAVPVDGVFGGKGRERELTYSLSLAGDTLTISF